MQIAVTDPELAAFVQSEIDAGRFETPEDVLANALELMRLRDRMTLPDVRAAIGVGIEQADRGELVSWDPDEIRRESERRIAAERSTTATGR